MVFSAETQSAGRGRNGRNWASETGGLFFTVLEQPGRPLADWPLFSMRAQLAAARTVEALTGRRAALRWPNDVYAGGGKIAGILTELSGAGDRLRWIAVGVGINVNNRTERALSCAELAGQRLSRREGLERFLGELEQLRGAGAGELRDLWNAQAEGLGAPVRLIPAEHGESKGTGEYGGTRGTAPEGGIFLGIDSRGRCRIAGAGAEPPNGVRSGVRPGVRSGVRRQVPVARCYPPGTVSLIYQGV
jgi:BirA family biotin operon repressor/biotin-[acetyl-CoA-carboxylase] ligase